MQSRRFYFSIGIALSVVVWLMASGGSAAEKSGAAPKVKVLVLEGEAAAVGKAHGAALGEPIRALHAKYLMGWFKDEALKQKALLAAFFFRPHLTADHRAELDALAGATGINPGETMLANCFLDLIPINACSTITLPAEASPDGIARFGRNLDFPGMDIADKHSVVLVFKPQGKNQFAAVSWPGLLGVLSGMNEHGLTLANMEVKRAQRMPTAMPYTLLYRRVLEECKTVEEAIALLEKTPRQTANNLMLMDASGDRAVVELTPEKVTVRRPTVPMSALMSTNHHRGMDCETTGKCRRYDSLLKDSKASFGRIDVKMLSGMLDRVSQGKLTLQSMIFEPSTRTIYLATGLNATKRGYERIDLREKFAQ